MFFSATAHALTVITPPDIDYTDLCKAAEACDEAAAQAALQELPPAERAAGLNRRDREGYTPLSYAARGGCMAVIELYVKGGADVKAADPNSGWTPLHVAAQARQAEAVRYLLSKGADVNAATAQGKTAWTEAVHGSLFNRAEGDRQKTLQILLENGADVTAADEPLRRTIREFGENNEKLRREIDRLQEENRRLNATLEEIRSRLGSDYPGPRPDDPKRDTLE